MPHLTVKELQAKYKPLYPDGENWSETKDYLLSDKHEKNVIDILVSAYKRKGKYNKPIVVDNDSLYVVDGTHRIIAASLIGDETVVRIVTTDSEEYDKYIEQETVDASYYEAKVTFYQEITDEDLFDTLLTILRSFPLTDDIWVTSDFSVGNQKSTTLFYEIENSANIIDIEKRILNELNTLVEETLLKNMVKEITVEKVDLNEEL